MDTIIQLAENLGKAIASSLQAANLRAARGALEKEKDVAQLLKEYRAQADKIAQLEQAQKPVEVQDKHKLQDLHDRLVSSEVFKKFTAAQVEFLDLVRRANEAIRRNLAESDVPSRTG
jgi:cell fate (sporulation/competence/biofilm development) regulator YlbF (YheA/YmcA/DUF963 family)